MNDLSKKGDDLMRKASVAFGGGRLQKAHDLYGKALRAYTEAGSEVPERSVLAHYTRALLAINGDADGDIGADLDLGDTIVTSTEFSEGQRFRGLLRHLRSRWRRQYDELEESQALLDAAREDLAGVGRAFDLFELEREQARLSVDLGQVDDALAAARRSLARAESPIQSVQGQTLIAEIHEGSGHESECLKSLEIAAGHAFDHELKEQLWELQDRIKYLKQNHPGLDEA